MDSQNSHQSQMHIYLAFMYFRCNPMTSEKAFAELLIGMPLMLHNPGLHLGKRVFYFCSPGVTTRANLNVFPENIRVDLIFQITPSPPQKKYSNMMFLVSKPNPFKNVVNTYLQFKKIISVIQTNKQTKTKT